MKVQIMDDNGVIQETFWVLMEEDSTALHHSASRLIRWNIEEGASVVDCFDNEADYRKALAASE